MAEINWTTESQQWLQAIYDHIADHNSAAAMRTVEAIVKKTDLLRDFPELGYRDESHPNREIRVILFGHYRIAYLIRSPELIDVLGVFHAALEMDRYLK